MRTNAVVIDAPERLSLSRVKLAEAGPDDVLVEISWSGISSGTERLLWSGSMPHFPGMGYPLIPGYESVGEVISAGENSGFSEGDKVFVPGARCFGDIRSLFGGQARRLVTPASRAIALPADAGEEAVLLALAATARHALADPRRPGGLALPDLIVGHGVLGRLLARIAVCEGGAPRVWERRAERSAAGKGYEVLSPEEDERKDYTLICDASGDAGILDKVMQHLAPRGEILLAGFYAQPLSFSFPPAFMREARIRIAAEWSREDTEAVRDLVAEGRLSLDGLLTHRSGAQAAQAAYRTAANDPDCLKMILDWRSL
ncbi:chlorophyll synthesis pathway protein BchC [Limibacillus halophilus]